MAHNCGRDSFTGRPNLTDIHLEQLDGLRFRQWLDLVLRRLDGYIRQHAGLELSFEDEYLLETAEVTIHPCGRARRMRASRA